MTKQQSTLPDASIFVDDDELKAAQYFEMITPLESSGATSLTYLVRKGKREYFMKRLKPEFKTHQAYQNLFHKEYEVGRKLDSPYIVKYEELAEDEEGLYLLCEHVCGATIEKKLDVAPEWFTVRKNLDRMFCQLLDALEHMHCNHVVHADLNPKNLMLTRINNDIKVIDLGFAFADGYTYANGYTEKYAAPEQQDNNWDAVDISTDIYAIGKLLEYINERTDKSLSKVYQRIMKRCLQTEQDKRYQSVDEIRETILHRKHVLRNLSVFCFIIAIITVVGYIFSNTTTGSKIFESARWAMKRTTYDIEVDHVYYRHLAADSSTCTVVGGRGSINGAGEEDGDNIKVLDHIPWTNGKTARVVAIADSAYFQGKNFTSLRLPVGLEKIGLRAFEGCEKITVVNVPPTVTEIGGCAFAAMKSLEKLYLPDSLAEFPIGLIHHCTKLKRISIPERVRVLPFDAFAGCEALIEVIIPPHLERIERGVFWECRSLPSVTLPATVKYIGEFAFFHCDNLKHVYLHATEPPQMCNAFRKEQQTTIHVPKASEQHYREHIDWKEMTIVGDL